MDYSAPFAPNYPTLSWKSFSLIRSQISSILDAKHIQYCASGRNAIAIALQLCGVKSNTEVLIPSYHCISMVEPVIWLGALPVYYRIDINTHIDVEDIWRRISPKTRAIIVPHFFGFAQNDFREIRRICTERSIMLIEDCAHAFFGSLDGASIGTMGDYSIASPTKFFPVCDGGILASQTHNLDHVRLQKVGAKQELKQLVNELEHTFQYGKMFPLDIVLDPLFKLKDYVIGRTKNKMESMTRTSTGISDADDMATEALEFEEFIPASASNSMSTVSRYMMKHSNHSHITSIRQRNYKLYYQRLNAKYSSVPIGNQPLNSEIPYVYSIFVKNPEKPFDALKRAGVPIIRFGEFLHKSLDRNEFPEAVSLARSVFQFPCHHEISADDITKITTLIDRHIP